MSVRASFSWPRWMTPKEAVAVILAQLVARDSQSKFSLQKKKKN